MFKAIFYSISWVRNVHTARCKISSQRYLGLFNSHWIEYYWHNGTDIGKCTHQRLLSLAFVYLFFVDSKCCCFPQLQLLSFRFHRRYLRLLSSQHFCTITSPSCLCCLLSPARDVCENRSALREQVQDYHTVCTGKLSHLASFVKKGMYIMYMWVMTSLHDSTGALLWVASSVNTVH